MGLTNSDSEAKVSVIVPIYKVEEYLDNCVRSILNQTYSNIEIILVDDGSPDNCGKICDLYAENDTRINVIHKENGGLSDARNVGIKRATGEYITCIDSDDYVADNYIEYLLRLIQEYNSDISCCGFIKTKEMDEHSDVSVERISMFSKEEALAAMLYAREFTTSAWGKLYKRELFNDIEYPIGKYSEDMFTTYRLIANSEKIVVGNRVCYFYMYRPGSILASSYATKHLDVFDALKIISKDGYISSPHLKRAYESQFVSSMAELLEKRPPICDEVDEVWNEAKKYLFNVSRDVMASKRVRVLALLMLTGRNNATFVITKYYTKKWSKND